MTRPLPPEGALSGLVSSYDGSLSGEPTPERLEAERALLRALAAQGTLSEAAAARAEETAHRTGEPVGRVLVASGDATEAEVGYALAALLELEYEPAPRPSEAASALVAEDVCRRHRFVPTRLDD